jgi:hypothetical protein
VRHAATALHAMNRAEHSHKVPGALALAAGEGPQPPAADLQELAGLVAPPQVSLNDPQAVSGSGHCWVVGCCMLGGLACLYGL